VSTARESPRALGFSEIWPASQPQWRSSDFGLPITRQPLNLETCSQNLRRQGLVLSQFDILIASLARQHQLTLLTADQDFQGIARLSVENWLL
jgi:hypothetical protein